MGGVGPPRVTEERKPSRCRPSAMLTCILETGIDVSPRRALDAFCMCEQTWARLTRDMLAEVGVESALAGLRRWASAMRCVYAATLNTVYDSGCRCRPGFNCASSAADARARRCSMQQISGLARRSASHGWSKAARWPFGRAWAGAY